MPEPGGTHYILQAVTEFPVSARASLNQSNTPPGKFSATRRRDGVSRVRQATRPAPSPLGVFMSLVLHVAVEMLSVVLCVALFFIILLEYRRKRHPAWLNNEYVVVPVTLIFTTWLSLGTGFLFKGLLDLQGNIMLALLVTPVFVIVLWTGMWYGIGMKRRLREAEEGRSPFLFAKHHGVAH